LVAVDIAVGIHALSHQVSHMCKLSPIWKFDNVASSVEYRVVVVDPITCPFEAVWQSQLIGIVPHETWNFFAFGTCTQQKLVEYTCAYRFFLWHETSGDSRFSMKTSWDSLLHLNALSLVLNLLWSISFKMDLNPCCVVDSMVFLVFVNEIIHKCSNWTASTFPPHPVVLR